MSASKPIGCHVLPAVIPGSSAASVTVAPAAKLKTARRVPSATSAALWLLASTPVIAAAGAARVVIVVAGVVLQSTTLRG